MPQPEPTLRESQSAFAAALRPRVPGAPPPHHPPEIGGPPGITPSARLDVYANNTRYFFGLALERTYPVSRHRVGDEHFQQLTHDYRIAHPSSRGDLHWIGESFPQWLEERTRGTQYEWLADLARLEWACERAWAAADGLPLPLTCLGDVPPEQLHALVLSLHPSVRLVDSAYPVWSVWQANQGTVAGPAVDLAAGSEHCVVACVDDSVVVYRVASADYGLLENLASGATLGAAIVATEYELAGLSHLLAWLFNERLVCGLRLAA